MAVTAADVKRLRDETDAPILEVKKALDEAGGDYDKAKALLREKGKAAAAKRADRATAAGTVVVVISDDGKSAGAVVLESETDFVAINESFKALAKELAEIFRDNEPGSDPLAVEHGGRSVGARIEEAISKIRENIKISRAGRWVGEHLHGAYVHHTGKQGAVVGIKGDASNLDEIAYAVAAQAVAMPPKFLRKDEVPQDLIEKELEIETTRAINEGKSPEIAKNIAQGRINKEYYKQVVLLEQPFYKDLGKSVGDYVAEAAKAGGGTAEIVSVALLNVGGESES
ncbi:MAG: translation elongation factor Ts [Fimbriimonadaceae bacterium]